MIVCCSAFSKAPLAIHEKLKTKQKNAIARFTSLTRIFFCNNSILRNPFGNICKFEAAFDHTQNYFYLTVRKIKSQLGMHQYRQVYSPTLSRYAIKFARSLGFLSPANPILVPGAYVLGFSKNSFKLSVSQTSATFIKAPE